MRTVTIDGRIAGYVRDDDRGRHIADRYILAHMRESGSSEPIAQAPQKAHRLDMAEQRSEGKSYR